MLNLFKVSHTEQYYWNFLNVKTTYANICSCSNVWNKAHQLSGSRIQRKSTYKTTRWSL